LQAHLCPPPHPPFRLVFLAFKHRLYHVFPRWFARRCCSWQHKSRAHGNGYSRVCTLPAALTIIALTCIGLLLGSTWSQTFSTVSSRKYILVHIHQQIIMRCNFNPLDHVMQNALAPDTQKETSTRASLSALIAVYSSSSRSTKRSERNCKRWVPMHQQAGPWVVCIRERGGSGNSATQTLH
jgi:hypothetical protein